MDQLDLTEVGRPQTKLSKLECPRFGGTDFKGWYLKIEQFFAVDQTREQDKVRTVMMHLDGKALQWHQRFMKNQGSLSAVDWNQYILEMRNRFSENEFTDPMLEIVSLKQNSSVEEFYEEFECLLNLLQLPDDYALSIFISNLKSDISKLVRLFYPKTLTHAFNLAKKMESLIFNTPRRPFLPYRNQQTPLPISTINQPPPRSELPPFTTNPRPSFSTIKVASISTKTILPNHKLLNLT